MAAKNVARCFNYLNNLGSFLFAKIGQKLSILDKNNKT